MISQMSSTGVDLSTFTSSVTDALSSTTAFVAYGSIAAAGALIGTGVKMGPKLFRYLWKFIPS